MNDKDSMYRDKYLQYNLLWIHHVFPVTIIQYITCCYGHQYLHMCAIMAIRCHQTLYTLIIYSNERTAIASSYVTVITTFAHSDVFKKILVAKDVEKLAQGDATYVCSF